jgi:hypothetical protein
MGVYRHCTAAAAALALSMVVVVYTVAASQSHWSVDAVGPAGGLDAAAAAAVVQGAHAEDRGAVRQLLARGGRNDPEVGAVLTLMACKTSLNTVTTSGCPVASAARLQRAANPAALVSCRMLGRLCGC